MDANAVMESGLPPEVVTMCFNHAVPRRLRIRVRWLPPSGYYRPFPTPVIEAAGLSSWATLAQIMDISPAYAAMVRWILREEGTLCVVEADGRAPSQLGFITDQEAQRLVEAPSDILALFPNIEIKQPHIIGFTKTNDFHNIRSLLLRSTLRVNIPRNTNYDRTRSEMTWEINTGSSLAYQPRALLHLMTATQKETKQLFLTYSPLFLHGIFDGSDWIPVPIETIILLAWGLAMNFDMYAGQLHFFKGGNPYGFHIAEARHATYDYGMVGEPECEWPDDWQSIDTNDVRNMILDSEKQEARKVEDQEWSGGSHWAVFEAFEKAASNGALGVYLG